MYSASLLFTYEGDGEALRAAIEENNAIVDDVKQAEEVLVDEVEATPPTDSPAAGETIEGDLKVVELMGDVADGEEEEDQELRNLPRIFSLKLIDFAHAEWVPGQGPDENSLFGVRSLIKIFEDLVQ